MCCIIDTSADIGAEIDAACERCARPAIHSKRLRACETSKKRGRHALRCSTILTLQAATPTARSARRTSDADFKDAGANAGVFTQDLAQDLDLNAVALDVVLENVRRKDSSISNERARSVMGALVRCT